MFGTKPYKLFGFNSYTNNGAIFNRLNKGVHYPKSGSRIGRALLMAQNQMFRKNTRRSRTTKVVVVITDGSSMDDVAGPSNALKARGVRIYCLGVGRYINGRQLDIMASPPRTQERNLLRCVTFSFLNKMKSYYFESLVLQFPLLSVYGLGSMTVNIYNFTQDMKIL